MAWLLLLLLLAAGYKYLQARAQAQYYRQCLLSASPAATARLFTDNGTRLPLCCPNCRKPL